MVARLNTTGELHSILDYNEQKVAQDEARLIHAEGFLARPERLSFQDKLDRFSRLNELNNRSKVNMLHASLNFDRSDKLSLTNYWAIADRYMQGLGMANQPYLVYQHVDAGHPHLHIVSSLIQPNRRRIRTHNMGLRLSEPTRLAIEKAFGLAPASYRQKKQPVHASFGPPISIRYGKNGAHQPSMAAAIDYTMQHYNVTTLAEFNAVLRQYNVIADPGGPHSRTRRTEGLTYRITDDQGRKRSAPIKASAFASQPTVARLEKLFEQNHKTRTDQLERLERRLARLSLQAPDSLRKLNTELQTSGIDLVLRQDRNGEVRSSVYIDQDNRIAIDAAGLANNFLGTFFAKTNKLDRGEQLSLFPPLTLPLLSGFSTQSPHLLSQLVDHPHFDAPDQQQTQEQQLQPRHRH